MEGLEHANRFYWIEAHDDSEEVLVVSDFMVAEQIMSRFNEGDFDSLQEAADMTDNAHIEEDRPW